LVSVTAPDTSQKNTPIMLDSITRRSRASPALSAWRASRCSAVRASMRLAIALMPRCRSPISSSTSACGTRADRSPWPICCTHSSAERTRRISQRPNRFTARPLRHSATKVMPPIARMNRNIGAYISRCDTATPISQPTGSSAWNTARRRSPRYSYSSVPVPRRTISSTKGCRARSPIGPCG